MSTKYGKFGKSVDYKDTEDTIKKRIKTQESPNVQPRPLTPSPFSSVQATVPQFQKAPELYEAPHKINPRYNTNIGQDMLAGAGVAMRGANGDPWHDIGLALGGLGAGAFKKNLQGKLNHAEDERVVAQQNQQISMQTEAMARAQQTQIAAQRQAQQAADSAAREARIAKVNQAKDEAGRRKELTSMIQTTTGEERRWGQQQLAKSMGYPDWENVDENFAVNWDEKKYGDVIFQTTRGGEIKSAMVDGHIVTDMSLNEWLDAIAKAAKLDSKVDAAEIKSARDEAIEALKDHKKEFTNAKGQFNPVQYNAQVLSLSRDILSARKSKPNGDLNIPSEININGAPVKINIPLMNGVTKQNNPEGPGGNSQFMPEDIGQAPPVIDATTGEAVEQKPPLAKDILPAYKNSRPSQDAGDTRTKDGMTFRRDPKTNKWIRIQ